MGTPQLSADALASQVLTADRMSKGVSVARILLTILDCAGNS